MRTTLLIALAIVALVAAPGAAAGASAGGAAPGAEDPTGSTTSAGVQGHSDAADASTTVGSSDEHDACEAVAGGPQRENPDNDTLGWENGCWYDDPIDVTVDDGLNDTELAAVVGRTMARIEQIRELEFEETVPVEVVSREEYRQRNADAFANTTEAERLHQNVKYEALFFVGEDADALAQIETNRGGSVLGYYSPAEERIVVISDDPETLELGELTLAHELVHAVQDQHFNISDYDRSTTEQDKATLGLIEGDSHYTEQLYEERCQGDWDCPSIESSPPETPPGFHFGLYLLTYQPYSDGPRFVKTVREDGGWSAVNDLYEDPPASSEQIISPEKHPDEQPVDVTVDDRSDDRWRILDLEDGVNYAEFGEVGLSTMFVYPIFEESDRFVTPREFQNSGPESDLDPYDYSNRYADGWAGDRLYPYVTDESAETNETGYVWKTVWDTEADAREFATAYTEMLDFRSADPVDGRVNTYRISDGERFGDAFYVNRTGATVVIVNAPTVGELDAVRAGAAPETPSTPTPSATESDVETTPTTTGPDGPPPTTTTAPGPGAVLAVVAVLLVAIAARRR